MIVRFGVWAPHAREVTLTVDGRDEPMDLIDGGWWTVEADAMAGSRYGFRLDGGPPLPDPRSHSQPDGVHGLSEVVDHGAHRWQHDDWRGLDLARAVLYEVHVGTFSAAGTFDGIVEHLDHLVGLGVTAVELLPVAEFPGARNWGYDGVDLWAPHHAYGGPAGLKRLVDACHGRGLGVVLDVVYNHVGPEGNHLATFGPYFTDVYRTPWGPAVNYDQAGSDEVRRFVIDNALMWLRDHHVDALRLDAVHAIVDTSANHLLAELAVEVGGLARRSGRRLWLIAESDQNDPRVVGEPARGGFGVDAQWSDDVHHALHVVLTGERDGYYEDFAGLADLATAIESGWLYAGQHSRHRDRVHGRALPRHTAAWRLLSYAQNHDQIGNRATGDRLAAQLSPARLKVAAALVLLGPGTPLLFQGEEWGATTPFRYFTSHDDVELGRAVAGGRRAEFAAFGWSPDDVPDPQDPETFTVSRLDWSEPEREPHASLLAWSRACIALRAMLPPVALADVRAEAEDDAQLLVVHRGDVTITASFAPGAERVIVTDGSGTVLLRS